MFSCLQILEAFLWFVLITLLNVTLIILTLSVSRLLNLLLRLVAFLLFLNPQCLASISRWITASSSWKRSEERFSRNAETDLVCRLLLEKKKRKPRARDPHRASEGGAARRHHRDRPRGRAAASPRCPLLHVKDSLRPR